MKNINNTDDTEESTNDKSVEKVWVEDILKPRGISEDQAMNIVGRIQAHPQLRSRLPTASMVEKFVTESIQRVLFDGNKIVEDCDEIVDEMLDVLRQGLNDQRPGPVSLPQSERSTESSTSDSARVDTASIGNTKNRSGNDTVDTATVDLSVARENLEMGVEAGNANQNPGILAGDAGIINQQEDDGEENEIEKLNEIREEHGRNDSESIDEPAIPEAQLQSIVTAFLGVSACYTVALRDLVRTEDLNEIALLERAWIKHDQAKTEQERRDATAAGVLLRGHAELGFDAETVPNQDRLAEAVDQWSEELPEAVLAVHTAIETGENTIKIEHLRTSVDREEFTREDLETLVFSQLLEELGRSVTDEYITALKSVLDRNPEEAIKSFTYAWKNRSDAGSEDEYIDAVAAGVGLLAHVSLGLVADEIIDETTVIEQVAINKQDLGDAVLAVYEASVDRTVASPAEFLQNVDSDRDDLDQNELETLAMAWLLELLQDDSAEGSGDSTIDAYHSALSSLVEEEPEEAIRKLARAWNSREEGEKEARIAGVAAGVALLAHTELGLELEMLDQQTLDEEVEVHRSDLTDPVTAVYDACTGKSPTYSPEEFMQQVETEDPAFEDLECLVFANLLSHFVTNPIFSTLQDESREL